MDPNKPQSPAWRNPRDTLRKNLIKRKSISRCLNASLNAVGSPVARSSDNQITESLPAPESPSLFKNPFKRASPRKKRILGQQTPNGETPPLDWDDSTANDSFSSPLLNSLSANSAKRRAFDRSQSHNPEVSVHEMFPLDFSSAEFASLTPKAAPTHEEKTSEEFPLDLRLATKMKVVVRKPFPWMKSTKTTGNVLVRIPGPDKHEGMKIFVNGLADHTREVPILPNVIPSPLAIFEACSLYWQYPSLPWMNFFPRAESLTRNSMRGSHLPKDQQEVICTQWSDCFDQLYLSWKKGDRKMFYVCCALFTVLFTKSDQVEEPSDAHEDSMSCFQPINGQRHVAIVSHTNYYVRQLFKNEGIEFELVRRKGRRSKAAEQSATGFISTAPTLFDDFTQSQPPLLNFGMNKSSDDAVKKTPENSDSEDPDENSPTKALMENEAWIKASRMSPRVAKKFTRHSSLENFGVKNLDDKKPNTVIIKDSGSLQALFNVLQTDKCVRSISGVLAGLPPTLIAPQTFVHAQMCSLTRTSQVIKRSDTDTEYICEFDGGPVLPYHVNLMSEYVRRSGMVDENCSATIKLSNRTACNGLNSLGTKDNEWTDITIEKSGYRWKIPIEK